MAAPRAPAPSLFCEHKKLRSVCALCGASRTGAAPARGRAAHDADTTLHAYRLEAQRRIRALIEAARLAPTWSVDVYYGVYDCPLTRSKNEMEDPSSYHGALYLALVKMVDVTVEGRRIQGYNGRAEWDEMRDYLFRKFAPSELPALTKDGRLLIHGGNGAWSSQQRAPDLFRHPRLKTAIEAIAFGSDGRTPDALSPEELAPRITYARDLALEAGIPGVSLPFASKLLHVFDPHRWPVVNQRANAQVGKAFGLALPRVQTPEDYVEFAIILQKVAKDDGHPDLDMLDIVFSRRFEDEKWAAEQDEEDA